jgi:hypothetical protein
MIRKGNLALGAAILSAVGIWLPTGAVGAVTTWDYHRDSLINATLTIKLSDPETGRIYGSQAWRAGSGTVQDACNKADPAHGDNVGGWLPTGLYDIKGHYHHYNGSSVRGRVWRLQDKACSDGTLRTELFIHSEETADNGQSCEAFCWDGPNDYYSQGCIKISRGGAAPTDLAQANDKWDSWDGRHGAFTASNKLYVHN